ncbi:MAG: response regulator [Spirulinaceae cyanobacterium RM2_2_10]|nr:response regulator [Spirulinaceae cyanobacterium RM2_2_10]
MTAADILVVDGNPADLHRLSQVLTAHSFSVRLAGTGDLAWQLLQTAPPDLVLLDAMLPDVDGYALCDRLRATPQTWAIPVIFISTLDQPKDKLPAFERGVLDYITKPYQPQELIARIQLHLENHRLRRQLEAQNEALCREQARWQLLLQGTGDYIYEWDVHADRATTFQYCTAPDREASYVEDLENYNYWLQTIHPDDRDRIETTFQAYLQRQIPKYDVEYRIRCRNGHYQWIGVRSQAQWDAAGDPLRVVGLRQDIGDRKRLEQQLADAHAWHEATFQSSLDALFLVTAETGAIEDCNPRALELFGFVDRRPPSVATWRHCTDNL